MKWAEATKMARGRGNRPDRPSRNLPVGESSIASIGEPWDKNSEGREVIASMRTSIGLGIHGAKSHAGTNALQDGNDIREPGADDCRILIGTGYPQSASRLWVDWNCTGLFSYLYDN